ncbi:hypothetical protein [Priestia aryabhattai]|uniref:hypothetical protein n=1 Tax=Priestia aryabhattai TaxID=412384 RepID=UPI001CFD4F0E|nr:hypothetical protein [Priestia aryabhattai]
MPKLMKASDVRLQKTFTIAPDTFEDIEVLRKKKGLSQGKLIDMAIKLLKQQNLSS